MNKIYKKALQNTELQAENLLNLIEYLPVEQKEVAMHIMLGEYDAPIINEHSTKLGNRYANTCALSYNPLTDEVKFEYNAVTIKTGWIANELIEKGGEVCADNFISKKHWAEDAMSDIKFEGTRQDFERLFTRHDAIISVESSKSESTTKLSNWQ